MMYREDWLRLLTTWVTVMPPVHDKYYNGIESDMYAYMIASAFLGLNHIIFPDFMKTCMHNERRKDIMVNEYIIHYCQRYHVYETRGGAYHVNSAKEFLSTRDLNPSLTNFSYSFSKYWIQARNKQKWIIECDAPLLVEPPNLSSSILEKSQKIKNHYKVLHKLVPG